MLKELKFIYLKIRGWRKGEIINAYKILVGKPEGKRLLGRP
jgi:hypothetical protein